MQANLFLYKLLATFGSYMLGFVFYAAQFPEKHWPGRFDLVGASHQIWHIFVFIGAFLFYIAVFQPHPPFYFSSCCHMSFFCTHERAINVRHDQPEASTHLAYNPSCLHCHWNCTPVFGGERLKRIANILFTSNNDQQRQEMKNLVLSRFPESRCAP